MTHQSRSLYFQIRVHQIATHDLYEQAAEIIRTYGTRDGWFDDDGEFFPPSITFGDFLQDIESLKYKMRELLPDVIESKRDEQIVKLAGICEPTAHQAALTFAERVAFEILQAIWTPGVDGPDSEFWRFCPIDGLKPHHTDALGQRWETVSDGLSRIEIPDKQELNALLNLEMMRVQGLSASRVQAQQTSEAVKQHLANPAELARLVAAQLKPQPTSKPDEVPATKTQPHEDPPELYSHSEDFRVVIWNGTTHEFTPKQAAVVKLMWFAWKGPIPERSGIELMREAESDASRFDDIFRVSSGQNKGDKIPAWKTMIVAGQKGMYRLAGACPPELKTGRKPG